ncbi:hypothetical protein [Flammeovirga sp. SJP92]|uniref:hypothetical protein n=1 Tax=Flammeovirga sp. SJP92 TaxID=1775430 RepID=UPI000786D3A6|nr:hypothetical protein [Flammeovirga sp. SJP92]KXX70895.1 hypothetical protein AVL50_11015 [Flammeovirga sp. SJP92]
MKILLRAKHWQIFLMMYGILILLKIRFLVYLFLEATLGLEIDAFRFYDLIKYIPFILIVCIVVFYGWLASVGFRFQKLISNGVNRNVGLFSFCLLLPFLYFLFSIVTIFNEMFLLRAVNFIDIWKTISVFLFPISIASSLYAMYFVAKTLTTIELQREVHLIDTLLEFYRICFFPYGIWEIQPKVNALLKKEE